MNTARNQVLVGDARHHLALLPEASVDMVLTSPPYFRLRNYQIDGQLGLEEEIEEWVTALRGIAAQVQRVLVPTGSFWLNVADTYATHQRQGASRKSLLLGPERLAVALLDDGWILFSRGQPACETLVFCVCAAQRLMAGRYRLRHVLCKLCRGACSAWVSGGVEAGYQLAVGGAGGGQFVGAFGELESHVDGLLFEGGDALVELVDVGRGAEPGLLPGLLAEGLGQPLLQL
ncbi:MAG TPA: DNA methyltransferase, partial [Candidatus Limnocylindria bacterium]